MSKSRKALPLHTNLRLEEKNPSLSIIVPTYNSAKTLSKCLESIRNQQRKCDELIVVDRHSQDETREIAEKFEATVLLKGPERSSQKNYGAKYAKGEFLYFVDSDFVLERDVTRKCIETCESFDAVSTVNYSVGRSLWGKSIALKERFLAHDPTIRTVKFIRRKVFLDIGGFDERLMVGEDLDVYARLLESGHRIGSVDAVEWHIGEPETLRDISRRSLYYGKVVRAYFAKRKVSGLLQLGPFKTGLFWDLIRTGSPYLCSLAIVDATRWISSLVGLVSSVSFQ